MLEKIPSRAGRALGSVRAGPENLIFNDAALAGVPARIDVTSSAFIDGGSIPARFTSDGPGVSPPLEWRGAPLTTAELVLLIEDPDAPMPHPLVHAIAWKLHGARGSIPEGALSSSGENSPGTPMGRNSYLMREYLPPDPPSGHGTHHYAFELFALDAAGRFESAPGRGTLIEVLKEHAIAKGMLVGTYQRR